MPSSPTRQQEVRLLRGLAELLAGQFVNGLQGLSVVAGHSSAKQAKLLRKVMALAVSVLTTTGVPAPLLHSFFPRFLLTQPVAWGKQASLEPELLDKLQQFL